MMVVVLLVRVNGGVRQVLVVVIVRGGKWRWAREGRRWLR